MVKMRKLRKRRELFVNWEGLYAFMTYKDEKGCKEFDGGSRIYIIKGIDGKQWKCPRCDLQMFN
jgi:hypothetical protein